MADLGGEPRLTLDSVLQAVHHPLNESAKGEVPITVVVEPLVEAATRDGHGYGRHVRERPEESATGQPAGDRSTGDDSCGHHERARPAISEGPLELSERHHFHIGRAALRRAGRDREVRHAGDGEPLARHCRWPSRLEGHLEAGPDRSLPTEENQRPATFRRIWPPAPLPSDETISAGTVSPLSNWLFATRSVQERLPGRQLLPVAEQVGAHDEVRRHGQCSREHEQDHDERDGHPKPERQPEAWSGPTAAASRSWWPSR